MEALLEHGEALVNDFLCHYNHNHDPNTGQFTSGASSGAIKKANKMHSEAEKHEPQITKDLQDAVELTNNGRLVGLENKLKSKESLARKSDLGKDIKDAVRYSVVSDDKNLFNDYYSVRESLEVRGYTETECKNYFHRYKIGEAKHKQITCNYKTPDKYEFEIQFHTEDSYKAKERKVPLYEEVRNPNVSELRKKTLENKMDRLAKRVKDPYRIDDITEHSSKPKLSDVQSKLDLIDEHRFYLKEDIADAKKSGDTSAVKKLTADLKRLDSEEKALKSLKHGEDLVNDFLCHYNHNHDPNTGQFTSGAGGAKSSSESPESRKHIIKSNNRADVAQRAASLSDKELQTANNRYNAEQQYIKNMYSPSKGKEYIANLLKKHGDQFLNTLLQKVEQQVAAELVNAATKALKSVNTDSNKSQEQTSFTVTNTNTPEPQQNQQPKKKAKKK